jgi:hypothetical protein
VFRVRGQKSNNAKRETPSENININGEYLFKLPDGRTQRLKIQTDNFGNLARVKTLGAPDYPEENRAFTPPQLNLNTDPQVSADQPLTTTLPPSPPISRAPPPIYVQAAVHAPDLRPTNAKAPIGVHAPLKYVAETSRQANYTTTAPATKQTPTSPTTVLATILKPTSPTTRVFSAPSSHKIAFAAFAPDTSLKTGTT